MKEQSKETRVKSTDPNEEYIATSIWLKKLFDPCPFLFLFFDSTDASFFLLSLTLLSDISIQITFD